MQARLTLKTMRLPLNTRVDEDLATDIEKQSVYVSEHLRKLTVSAHPPEVEITYDDGCDIDELCSKVSRFIASMVRGHRRIEPTIHHRRTRAKKRPYVEDVFGKLKGEPAHTGCAGIGLERWVLALFTQHGFDPRAWPESLRDAF